MQVTVYFGEEDVYLIRLVGELARKERKSRSAVMLSILEEHFGRGKRLGELLVTLGAVPRQAVEQALEVQRTQEGGRRLGEILLERGWVAREDLERALLIQQRVAAG